MPETRTPALPVSNRRGFLRQLCALPLIGGSVTLIGAPTAAAVTISDALHERYTAWLAHEHLAAVREHRFRAATARAYSEPWDTVERNDPTPQAYIERHMREATDYIGWLPDVADIKAVVGSAAPSTRAAVILAAAGLSLTGGRP